MIGTRSQSSESTDSTRLDSGAATPLVAIAPGALVKLECNNPGGSHKARAARHIVRRALERGEIVPGKTTVIEKTGGSFGFGLTLACAELGVSVELAVGLGFSATKRRCLEIFGAKLIGLDLLHAGATPREVVEHRLANAPALGKHYYYTDQFHNPGSVEAHEQETGPEIVAQLRARREIERVTFVACAGTGASLTGIARCLLAAGYRTNVILVEPEGCRSRDGTFVEHRFEGMAVGVTPPLLDWTLVTETRAVTFDAAMSVQRRIAQTQGYFVGNTAAACLSVALEQARTIRSPGHTVLTLVYDHGLWYVGVQ